MWLLLLQGVWVSGSHFKSRPDYGETDCSHRGEKQLTEGFPRQELQLPTQPSSQRVSPVCSLSHFSLWPAPRHTIPQQKAYAGHSLKVLATTFTHLPFEMDNYHMWPKSPPLQVTQSSFCELGNPAWQSESPESPRRGIQVLRWEKRQGRWSLRKVRVTRELSVWGGQGAWGPPQLDSGPLSLQPLCGPARVFYSSRRGDKSVCGLALFCGKSDPMLVNPSRVEVCPHLFPDCMQINASICLSGEQNGLFYYWWLLGAERSQVCVFEGSCNTSEQVGVLKCWFFFLL